MTLPKAPVHYRIIQNGQTKFYSESVYMVLRSRCTGVIGNVACFSEISMLDFYDRRRGRDIDANYFNGPATIEILTPAGEVISRIGLATKADVADHARGRVACS